MQIGKIHSLKEQPCKGAKSAEEPFRRTKQENPREGLSSEIAVDPYGK